MLEKFKTVLKVIAILFVYLVIVIAPFVLGFLLRSEALTMAVFGAFLVLYLITNYFGWHRPRLWRFGEATTDMLIAGLFTCLITGFNFSKTLSVVAGIALADLLLTSVALILLHVVSFVFSKELFNIIEVYKKHADHILFKVVRIVSPEVYGAVVVNSL